MRAVAAALFCAAVPHSAAVLSTRRSVRGLQDGGDLDSTYYWPEPRGHPGNYSASPFTAPRQLSAKTLAWSWFNGGPEGKYSTAGHSGLVMDGERNIFLSSTDGIRKFDAAGKVLWHAKMKTWRIPALHDGKLYVTSNEGKATALDMETGTALWTSDYTKALGTDISGVAVTDGLMLCESAGNPGGGAGAVAALDLKDGHKVWEFQTSSQLWNFMPMITGNGSFIFQDQIGGVYHLRTRDGKLLWHSGYSGPWANEMTDGLAMVADGLVYAVHSDGLSITDKQTANLRAYDLATGKEVWNQLFQHPANSQPAVARLGKGPGLSDRLAVVMPIGAQPLPEQGKSFGYSYDSSISAFDAKTGELIWEYTPPRYGFQFVAGDLQRFLHGTLCLPNPYGSPSVDARGTVYTGHFNGMVYAIRDDNGDGKIEENEVSKYNTGAGFSHGGAVIAPGTLAIPSCDGLFVFRE